VFAGSIVSYATEVKRSVLGVGYDLVVTEEAAVEMAEGARSVLGVDVAIAVTGVAGPDTQEGRPAGTLCVAAIWPGGSLSRTLRLPGQREPMRQMSVISSLDLLRRALLAAEV
jgi:nicotinamide-nucleotide amidase